MSASVGSLPLSKLSGGPPPWPYSASLFIYRSLGKCPSLFLRSSECLALFASCLFLSCLFIYYSVLFVCFFFFARQGSVCSRGYGLCWYIPRVAVGVLHATYLLTCWSASPKQVRRQCLVVQKPSWFLCVRWHGEAMCELRVWRFQSFASSWWFFLCSVSPASSARFLL
jgi:hypothetical protein